LLLNLESSKSHAAGDYICTPVACDNKIFLKKAKNEMSSRRESENKGLDSASRLEPKKVASGRQCVHFVMESSDTIHLTSIFGQQTTAGIYFRLPFVCPMNLFVSDARGKSSGSTGGIWRSFQCRSYTTNFNLFYTNR
jgi:hypothetical protein